MNRGVLQSSVMQQIMGSENPNWWNMMRTTTTTTQQSSSSPNFLSPNNNNNNLFPHSSSSLPFPSNWYYDAQDQLPESWSQLLLGGLVGEDDQKGCMGGMFQAKKLEDWEEEILNSNNNNNSSQHQDEVDVKKEHSVHASSCTYVYGGGGGVGVGVGDDYPVAQKQNWSPMIAASSPQSCVTSFSSNMLDFSNNNNNNNNNSSPADSRPRQHPPPDRSSECNSNATGGAVKKARVQSSSNQTTFKVRKEKLGDRITALHQLVSPFGKTDTASVLLEAIGYIRFLHSQIEALGLPYLGNTSGSTRQQQQQHSVQGERNCVFPEDPGQDEEPKKDLRSRGLCLVPVSCTLQVGSDNGADYWAPAFGGGFR